MIRFLPMEVRSCLRSGITTPSIAQCVEELVLNSMDAEATCVAVRVDIPNCKIQVVDNGRGLTKEDFELVGQRYATSKCHQLADLDHLEYFGYRGEALASISHISSVLEIVSRVQGSEVTLSKLFRNGKSSEVFEATRKRPSIGTTITVHSVFHNMPVRRKMISASLDYERVCQRIEGLALIHPRVSFSLRDDSTGTKSIQTRITSSLINTFRFLFGQAKAKSLKEIAHQNGKFSISGYMSVEGHPNKNLQFVYVNNRLVLKTRLHKAVNYLLRKSLIANYRPRFGDRESAADSTDKKEIDVTNSPGRSVDQYGIFVLNIKCPPSEYDICLEPSKSLVEFREWSGVLHCIEQLVNQFLAQESLTMTADKEKQENSPNDKGGILMLDDGSSQEDNEVTEDQEVTELSCGTSLSQKYGRGISATACSNTLRSLTVRRPLRKSSSVLLSQSSVSDEELETQETEVKADFSRSEMLVKDEAAPKINKISPCGSEDSVTKEHSERQEITNNDKITYPIVQPSTDIEESSLESNLKDSSTDASILQSTISASGGYKHLENNVQLAQINSQSPKVNCTPIEPVPEAKLQNPTSCSPCLTVSSGPSDYEPAAEIIPDSEETEEAVSVIFSSSENEILPILEGHDNHDCICQLGPESQPCSSVLDQETSYKTESKCSPSDVVHDGCASKCQQKCFDEEKFAVSKPSKNEFANSSLIPRDENSPVCLEQHKQVEGEITDTRPKSHSVSSKEKNSNLSSPDLKMGGKEEYEDQFITPKTKNPDILRNYDAKLLRKQKTSSASSVSSFGGSSFNSEIESETSDSCVLIEQDEISVSSKSAGISPKHPDEACHVISEVKSHHHFIALDPFIDNGHRNKNLVTGTSSSLKYLDGSTSSLQIFKKSIQAKTSSNKSVRQSISELLHGKDEQAASRFFPQDTWTRQSAHFTSTSPVVLKRRFTPGLMMLGKDRTDERSPNKLQMSARPSGAMNKDAKDHNMSVQVTLTENSISEKVGTGKTTQLSVLADKQNCDELETNGCLPGSLKRHGVMTNNMANDLLWNLNLISKEQKNSLDGVPIQEEKVRKEHTSIASRPNLKRLRQIPLAPVSNSSGAEVLTFKDQENLINEKGADKKGVPPTKRFMTSDSFLQAVPPLHSDVVITTKETPRNFKKLQDNSCSLTDPSSPCHDRREDNRHKDNIVSHDVLPSKYSKSSVWVQEESDILSSICEGVDIKKADDSRMEIQEKDLTSEGNVLKRTGPQQQVDESGCCSDHLSSRKTVSYPAEVFPPCLPQSEDSASENTPCSYLCQNLPESLLDTSSNNLPSSVVLCSNKTFTPREKNLTGSIDSDSQCVISQNESMIYQVDVCCELSEGGSFECTDYRSPTSAVEHTVPVCSSPFETAPEPPEKLSQVCDLEIDVTPDGHENVQDQSQVERERNSDITAEEHEGVYCLGESPCTSFPDKGIDKSGSLLGAYQKDEPEKQQTSCPKMLTDICGKSWSCQYDTKLNRQVYIDLNTGNCSLITPVLEKAGSTGDGMIDEETTNARNDTCALIIPVGRKKSHLHRFHSLCAQPFLTVSPEMTGPHTAAASCSHLSPSSHSALIHMVDDHIDQQGSEIASKWRGEFPIKQTDDSGTMDQLFDDWTNPMFASLESDIMDAQTSHMPRNSIRAQNIVHPYRFTKEMFQDIKVLGQVDSKFIACMVSTEERNQTSDPHLLLLIDQHAAHERVRLEQLTSDVFEDPSIDDCTVEQSSMKSSSVIPPVELSFPRRELRLLHSFSNKLERLGISYRIIAEDDETDEGKVEITRLPACIVEREAAELKRGRQPVAVSMVQALLAEHLEVLQMTSGASGILPKTITRVLNSQACHGAIKFGDRLNHQECLSLIGQLSHCDLPFQCAHGRPSLVPLCDLKLLATKLDEVDECKPRLSRLQHPSR